MAEIAGDVAVNPDAQAAVTDFLDYTEYLPADLIRSLTLIRGLDETYHENTQFIHELTKSYGELPSLPACSKPNSKQLRLDISTHLDQALNARESSYAEACRLYELTDRHQNRLKSIIAKLNALPKPPSRDPTPQPQAPSSAKRSRSGRKVEVSMSGSTRLTIKPPRGPTISILSRPKHRRVTVPGEVMPPYDPDEPIASTEVSDWDSEPSSPARPILKLKQPKLPKTIQLNDKESRKSRETITYRKPTPPPEDAEIGSRHRPWTHLTEYEMYKLRKKMKKNHTWEPSDVMIRRELAEKGRGWDHYYKAKADAQKNATKFIDIDMERDQNVASEKIDTPKVTPTVITPFQTSAIKSKPGKKVELKKEKKEGPVQSRATLAAQEAELAARRLGDIGSAFKNLFSPLSNAFASLNRSTTMSTVNNLSLTNKRASTVDKNQKKRTLDEAGISTSPSVEPEAQKKKQKTMPTKPIIVPTIEAPSAGTIKIPLRLPSATSQRSSVSGTSTPVSSTRRPSTQPPSIAPKSEMTPPLPSRPPSRRSIAASVEPQAILTSRSSRRASGTPGPALSVRKTPIAENAPRTAVTAASWRSKRDAPGTVTQSSQDGGAAVSVSKRKSKPNKSIKIVVSQKAAVDTVTPQLRIDIDGKEELVDPDEERYCICRDVSWGEMICCELDEKCEYGQWFHMECVGLVDQPPRTAKWYCPEDRKRYHKGEQSNGLVGRNIK